MSRQIVGRKYCQCIAFNKKGIKLVKLTKLNIVTAIFRAFCSPKITASDWDLVCRSPTTSSASAAISSPRLINSTSIARNQTIGSNGLLTMIPAIMKVMPTEKLTKMFPSRPDFLKCQSYKKPISHTQKLMIRILILIKKLEISPNMVTMIESKTTSDFETSPAGSGREGEFILSDSMSK